MRIVVDFQDESLEFDVPPERVVASWRGPVGASPSQPKASVRDALENPRDFPPLRQMIVPGDKVVLAVDPTIPQPRAVLAALVEVLAEVGIEHGSLTWLAPPNGAGFPQAVLPDGSSVTVHDPDDRAQLAYLASTKQGRRVYLNRLLTDADVVVPVGRIGYDPDLGYRGPWSVLFPELSDRDTMRALRDRPISPAGEEAREQARARSEDSLEVSWLLGTQFHLGLVPAAAGLLESVAGRDTSVRDQGIAALDQHWTFRAPARAEVVVAGVGRPGTAATLADLAHALTTATRLVQHGGKIVLLSQACGSIGPALRRLIDADDPRNGIAALRGQEKTDDYLTARRLAQALAWADLFLYSALEPQVVEDLSIVPLERPEQARRIVAHSGSSLFVSQAELTLAEVDSDEERDQPPLM
jgi:nickel-dependent lactate racemase